MLETLTVDALLALAKAQAAELEALRQERDDLNVVLETTTLHSSEIENELQDKNEELTASLAALQEAQARLVESEQRAQAANRTKSAFLANVSHELRTPLNAIIGYSELLQEEAPDYGADALIPDLAKITSSGRHLLRLINELLDLSKIEAGKIELHPETFELEPLVQELCDTVRPLAAKNGTLLEVNLRLGQGTLHTDKMRFRQSVLNLLSNACKFTDRGRVTLTVESDGAEGAGQVTVHVVDTGIGMTEEQLGRLFQEFVQADVSITSKYGGTGLGLAISRRFCQLMGGDITVKSTLGKGSTFTLRIPMHLHQ